MRMASSPSPFALGHPGVDVPRGPRHAHRARGPCGGRCRRSSLAPWEGRPRYRAGQHADGGLVDRRPDHRRDAARHQGHAALARAFRRKDMPAPRSRAGAGRCPGASRSIAATGLSPTHGNNGASGRARRGQRQRGPQAARLSGSTAASTDRSSGRAAAGGRSPRYGRGRDRPGACSARRTDRSSCRRGRTGSGRYA